MPEFPRSVSAPGSAVSPVTGPSGTFARQETPRTVLVAGFVAALALLATMAWLDWRHSARMQETAAWVVHSYQVQADRNLLLALVLEIEIGQRSYVLTGQPVFLQMLERAVDSESRQERKLEELTRDEEQQANLRPLRQLIAKRIELARHTVTLRESLGVEAAAQEVATLKGKKLTDEILAQFDLMDGRAKVVLEERSAAARREVSMTRRLLAIGTVLSIALLASVFALVLRENRLRRRSESELDRFFTLSLDLLGIAGTDGYFKRLNPAFGQTLGYTTDELLARPFLDFVHPEDRGATLAEVVKLGHGEPTLLFENRYRCKDGSWRWLSWRTQPFPQEGLLYATARDVTEWKRAEENIQRLNTDLRKRAAQLEEANEELEAFSYSVSHDLRAPLRAIDGFCQILLEDHAGSLDAAGQGSLARVRAAAQRMGALIDDILMLSRVTRGEMVRQPVDLSALAVDILDELQRREPERRVAVTVESGLVASADSRLLRVALENLLGNAFKFTRHQPETRLSFTASRTDGTVAYCVKDNGAGFNMEYADKLFTPFQRLHSPREFEGTGIGLAMVARIIHRHGGEIRAEAAVGQGASIYFTLGPDGAEADRKEATS